MRRKLYLSLTSLVVASLALSACGGVQDDTAGKKKQIFNMVDVSEPPQLNSAKTSDASSLYLLNNVMEGLYRMDKNNEPIPAIANDVKISGDKKTYTFTLRDAKWSDGKPVTAKDFEFAWKTALDPKTKAEYSNILYPIKGAEAFNMSKGKESDVGVKAIDDKTLKVELKNPVPYFLNLTTFGTFKPIRQDIYEKYGSKYATEPDKMVYNGPFVMSEWKHEKSYDLKKNDSYWDKKNVKLAGVHTDIVKDQNTAQNLYQTGKTDFTSLSQEFVDKWKGKPEVMPFKEATTFYLQFNTKNKFFKNAKIRKAISMAVDRKTMTDKIEKNGSKPAGALVPPNIKATEDQMFREMTKEYVSYDKKEAKKLLKEGMKEEGIKKIPSIELLGYDSSNGKKDQEYLKEQLNDVLGIDVDLRPMPFSQKLDLENKGKFQITFAGWGADYNDPMTFLDMWITGNSFNRGKWSNKEFDKLIKKSQANPDFKQRIEDLKKAEAVMMDEAPIAPLYYRSRLYLKKPYVKGLVTHPFGADFTFKWMSIEEK